MSNLADGCGRKLSDRAPRQRESPLRSVRHIEHDLEQRVAAEISLRVDFLDHSFERQILMCIGVQANFSDSLQ